MDRALAAPHPTLLCCPQNGRGSQQPWGDPGTHSLTRRRRCPGGYPAGTARPSPCSVSGRAAALPWKTGQVPRCPAHVRITPPTMAANRAQGTAFLLRARFPCNEAHGPSSGSGRLPWNLVRLPVSSSVTRGQVWPSPRVAMKSRRG